VNAPLGNNGNFLSDRHNICSSGRYEDVHTNQVHDTINELGKKSGDSGRTTPVPSRHIGEVFAENKIGAEWKVKQVTML